MHLNIKNHETHALAAQLAAITGESMAKVVNQALREKLARLSPQDEKIERLLAISRDAAARFKEPWRSMDINELLYDEMGLPK